MAIPRTSTHPFEVLYLNALLRNPAVTTVPLGGGRDPAPIKDVYVHRTMVQETIVQEKEKKDEPKSPAESDRRAYRTVKLPVNLWSTLHKEKAVLIEGPANMGKSTLTKQLVWECIHGRGLLPIWIPFSRFVGPCPRRSLLDYLNHVYVPELGEDLVRERHDLDNGEKITIGQWLYDGWLAEQGVLILDGLDEVFDHQERVKALYDLPLSGDKRCRGLLILTSRPLQLSLPLMGTHVKLQGLTPTEIESVIDQYQTPLTLSPDRATTLKEKIRKAKTGSLRDLITRPGQSAAGAAGLCQGRGVADDGNRAARSAG